MIPLIYLDNAATTKIHPDVVERMLPYLVDGYGNAGARYSIGIDALNAVNTAREKVAGLIRASPEQIIFTSGGTESNNFVFNGIIPYLRSIGKTKVITSSVEHDSVLNAVGNLPEDFTVDYVGVKKDGTINLDELRMKTFREDVGLVSVMYENNETGAINPIVEVGKICRFNKALFHTDCVQAAGFVPIDVRKIGCDFLSISSHKIHGPKGVGALYAKDKTLLTPIIRGGSRQEFGLRGGTENVAGIVGFGEACEIFTDYTDSSVVGRALYYSSYFLNELVKQLDGYGIRDRLHINIGVPSVLSKTLSIRFDGVDSETLMLMLDAYGICVSAGSACKSREAEPSRVLTAIMGDEEARQTVRVSFSILNNERELMVAAYIMANCVSVLSKAVI